MPNSDKSDFFSKVYEIVARIPAGKVATYGDIAQAAGLRSSARMVGWALNAAKDRPDIPCHRVINRSGELTGKRHFATPYLMHELLESEGVRFTGDKVDIESHRWVPDPD